MTKVFKPGLEVCICSGSGQAEVCKSVFYVRMSLLDEKFYLFEIIINISG